MKLRILDNHVRLRLTQEEVEEFCENGQLVAITQFGPFPGNTLKYCLKQNLSIADVEVTFEDNYISVLIASEIVDHWKKTEEVRFEKEITISDNYKLHLLIEKDLKWSKNRNSSVEDEPVNANDWPTIGKDINEGNY